MTAERDEPRFWGVLPCIRSDYSRARLQFFAFLKFRHPLSTILLLCPESQVDWFREQIEEFEGRLDIRVVSELEIVPELNEYTWVRGWVKQQLLKLAAAPYVQSDFYVTLDADVILRRDATVADFVTEGRAKYALLDPTPHMTWYRGSWRVLGVPFRSEQREHNVTPAILSRHAVLELIAFLEKRGAGIQSSWDPRTLIQRAILSRRSRYPEGTRLWTLLLASFAIRRINEWTEYSMYYSFLEATGTLDRYHVEAEKALYDTAHSIRKRQAEAKFERLDWTEVFSQPADAEDPRPPFLIIQSVSKVPLAKVLSTLAPLVDAPSDAASQR